MFDCDKCGLCCIGLDKNEITAEYHNGDGICKHLDMGTMLCDIYEKRPIFCRIDEYYEEYLADKMDRKEYDRLNYKACALKKQEYEECGKDIYKMISKKPELDKKLQAIIDESLENAAGTVNE